MAQKYSKYFRGEIRRGKGGKLSSLVLLILLILFAFSTVAAATCTYTLCPTNYGFSPSSGMVSMTVTASSSSCFWTATSSDSWITVTSGSSGTGNGTVTYSVAANTTGSARKGTITVAEQTIIIRQAGSTFTDDPQNVFTPYIYSIFTEGITVGCGSGMYCPSSYVTRGQMAAFIIRSKFGETFGYTTTPYYNDVPSTNTFFKYVQKLKDEGITTTTGTYMVDDIVTREQMAAFIIRAKYGETFSYTTVPYFSDVASTSVFYKYVQKLKDDAITTTTGTYMASSYVTRDQMAAFLGRAFLGMGNDRTVPSAPTGVIATPGNGQVTVSWAAAAGATSYNIYWSTTSGVTKTNGTKISSATSPYTHTSRTNGTTYYYIVTAVNSSGESVESAQVSVAPTTGTGKIAFVSYRDGNNEIYTMNTDGSNQQRITTHTGGGWTDGDDNPIWSPNAEKIVFTSWRDSLNELFIVNADGTGEARLTSNSSGTNWNDCPSWSPNGDKIAFESYRTGQVQIYIMNADGSNQTRLTYATNPYSSDIRSFTYPSWSPDGSKIVCDTHWGISGPVNDAGGIYAFSVNTGYYTQLTHSSNDYNAVWSPDGSKIAFYRFASNNTSGDIYVMNSNGSGLTRLTEGINPAWSPDGSKIAFISEKTGDGLKLYVIQSDGSGEINLMGTLDYMGVAWTPSWSPDGEKLVFGYPNEIYLVNSDGSGLKKITTNAQGSGPMWSPK